MPRQYGRGSAKSIRALRLSVWQMYGGVCSLCGCSLIEQGYTKDSSFDLDHERSQESFAAAGLPVDNSIGNLRVTHGNKAMCPVHGPCNQRKGHKDSVRARAWIRDHPWQGAGNARDDFEDFEDCEPVPEPEPVSDVCPHGKPVTKYCLSCKGGIA